MGDLPYGASIEVNIAMIDLMCELGDDDPCDLDWLPPSERKKLEQRIRGPSAKNNVTCCALQGGTKIKKKDLGSIPFKLTPVLGLTKYVSKRLTIYGNGTSIFG